MPTAWSPRRAAAKQRVFVVGIGSAPAEGVLKRLAEASGGACEFVAPNEDAKGAILRMFARLRAPRVERAEIAWPATVAWTTRLPGGLFGGETIHAFAGFAAAPSGDVALQLIARGEAKSLTASAALPATVVEDRTLARVAAARRIETASEAAQLKLALDYGLLTAHTNLLVVHERVEGEKAQDLPALARVAQMHAAGWHGVGSVREVTAGFVNACMRAPSADISFDRVDPPAGVRRRTPSASLARAVRDYADLGDSTSDFTGADRPTPDRESSTSLDRFFAAIEGAGSGNLPATLEDLAEAGLPSALLDELWALIVAGHVETDVVRAFLETLGAMLVDGSIRARVPRQFARTLRRQFAGDDEARELRWTVRDAVGAALRMTVA